MATIYQYKKYIDDIKTVYINLPEDCGASELAVIDDITYVSVPEGVVLPEQPKEITVTATNLNTELKIKLRKESPHLKLIDKRFVEKLREKYSIDDELYFARIVSSFLLGSYVFESDEQGILTEYQNYVEDLRVWAKEQRANLGL